MSTSSPVSEQNSTITSTMDVLSLSPTDESDTVSARSETQNTSPAPTNSSGDSIHSERTSHPSEISSPSSTATASPPSAPTSPHYREVISISINVAFRRQDDTIATWDEVEDATRDPELRNFFLRRIHDMFHEIERCVLPRHDEEVPEDKRDHRRRAASIDSPFYRHNGQKDGPQKTGKARPNASGSASTAHTSQAL